MKVIYFSKYSELGPSSRYRIYQFLPHLATAGIHCRVRPLFGTTYFRLLDIRPGPVRFVAKVIYTVIRFLRRIWDLVTIGRADLIVIEGQLFPYVPPLIEQLLAWLQYRTLLEFDDAIYLTRFHQRKIPAILRSSMAAIVGNDTLARYALAYTPRVSVIPTVIDTKRFRPPDNGIRRCAESSTIGWIGLAYNFHSLNLLQEVLRELQRSYRIRFRIISSRAPSLPGVQLEFKPWSLESEVVDLQSLQIGVMPLSDDAWARGKCGLKLLQYMATGIPAVASPVGVNVEIIRDGENGFLAASEKEWHDRLARLCEDSDLRIRMGQAARRTVEERYSLQGWAPRLTALYREMAEGSP